jgi:glycosyltransferase involved in cell wall biosynthesis
VSARLCSVVVPVRDGERFLGAALASVFAQTYRPIEVIVVDDGSTDGSAEVAARWPFVRLLQQDNAGVGAARNAGLALARGAFMALLDADDLWEPDKLARQIAHLDAHPELGYVCSRYRNFLEPGHGRPDWISEAQLAAPQVGTLSSFVARAETLERVGRFDPRDTSDLDWSLRAREAGVRLGVVEDVLVLRRIHDRNLTQVMSGGQGLRFQAVRAALARRRGAGGSKGGGGA